MSVLLGLASALAWGSADFFAALSTKRAGEARTLLFVQLFGLALAAASVALQGAPLPPAEALPKMLALGLLYGVSTQLFYRAMAVGKVSVVSPLASSYAIVSAVLTWISGGRPGPAVVVGVAALTVGVALVARAPEAGAAPVEVPVEPGGDAAAASAPSSAAPRPRLALRGVPQALGAAALFGVYFWAFDGPARTMGPHWSLLVTRVSTTFLAAAMPAARGARPFLPGREIAAFMLGAAVLDNVAFLLFQHGVRVGRTDVVVPLSSQFAAVTVLLGCLYMRERPSRVQWAGVIIVLAGVLLVSL